MLIRFHPIRIILNNIRWSLMDHKFAGEQLLRHSGLQYTVVRPAGLTNKPAGETKSILDTKNRSFPGNPNEGSGQLYTKCYDTNKQIAVRIIDSCNCVQVLPDGTPGVPKGGEVRRQSECCAGYARE
eukprot:gene7587-7792_t